jgi:hypothetical protein
MAERVGGDAHHELGPPDLVVQRLQSGGIKLHQNFIRMGSIGTPDNN